MVEDAVIITKFQKVTGFIGGAFTNVFGALATRLGAVGTAVSGLITSIAALFGGGTVATVGATVAVVAALAAGFAYLLNRAELLKPAIKGIMAVFNEIKAVVVKAFGGISDALAAGEYILAAENSLVSMKLAFYKGINAAIDVIPQALLNGVSIIKKLGSALVATIVDIFKALPKLIYASLTGTQSVYKIIADIFTGNFDKGEIEKLITKETKNLDRLTSKAANARKSVEEVRTQEQKNLEYKEKKQQAEQQARDNEIAAAQNAAVEMNRQINNISAGVHQFAASLSDADLKKANTEANDRISKLRDEAREMAYGKVAAEQYRLAVTGVTLQRRGEIAALQAQLKVMEIAKKAQEKAAAIRIDITSILQGEAAANKLKLAQEGLTKAQIESLGVLEAQKAFVKAAKEASDDILASQEKLSGDKYNELARSRELAAQGLNEAQIQEVLLLERRKRALDEQVEAQKKLIDDAKDLKDSIKPPLQKFREEVDKIRKMQAANLLTPDEASKAIANARKNIGGSINGIATTVTDRGANFLNAIRTNYAGSEGDKLLQTSKTANKIALRQEALQKRQLAIARKRHIAKFGAA